MQLLLLAMSYAARCSLTSAFLVVRRTKTNLGMEQVKENTSDNIFR